MIGTTCLPLLVVELNPPTKINRKNATGFPIKPEVPGLYQKQLN